MQHKLRSLTELPMYKENIMNGKYPQRICKYCKMKTTFYCSDLENDYLVSYCGFGHFQRLLYSSSHRNGFLKLIDSLILVHFIIAVYVHHDNSALYQFKRISLSQLFCVLISWFEFVITILYKL